MRIDDYRFGRIRIDGADYTADVVILGDRVLTPWWRQAGGHVYAPGDLQAVIDAAPAVVLLGTGFLGMVEVRDETVAALRAKGSEVVIDRTGRAVEEYNRRRAAGEDVAAAMHLTC